MTLKASSTKSGPVGREKFAQPLQVPRIRMSPGGGDGGGGVKLSRRRRLKKSERFFKCA